MTNKREAQFEKFSEEQRSILITKGHDYAAGNYDHDPNYNFIKIAELLDGAPITPYTVALIYFLKHVFSIMSYAKTSKQESGESVHSRHLDLANYAFIMDTLSAPTGAAVRKEKEEQPNGDKQESDTCYAGGLPPMPSPFPRSPRKF